MEAVIGAKMTEIKNVSFGRSVESAIASGLITSIMSIVFSIDPVIEAIIGFFIGLFFAIFVIKKCLCYYFLKSFLDRTYNIYVQIVAVLIALYAGIGGIKAISQKF